MFKDDSTKDNFGSMGDFGEDNSGFGEAEDSYDDFLNGFVNSMSSGFDAWSSTMNMTKDKPFEEITASDIVYALVSQEEAEDILETIELKTIYNFKKLFTGCSEYGEGLNTYRDRSEYLENKAKQDNKKVIAVHIDNTKIISQFNFDDYARFENMAKQIDAKSTEEIYNYIRTNGGDIIGGVEYLSSEGKSLLGAENIREFMGPKVIIYNTSIIRRYSIKGER